MDGGAQSGGDWIYIQLVASHLLCCPESGSGPLLFDIFDNLKKASGALSVNLQTTPSWVGVLMCWRVGRLCRGIWMGWVDGPRLLGGITIPENVQKICGCGTWWNDLVVSMVMIGFTWHTLIFLLFLASSSLTFCQNFLSLFHRWPLCFLLWNSLLSFTIFYIYGIIGYHILQLCSTYTFIMMLWERDIYCWRPPKGDLIHLN